MALTSKESLLMLLRELTTDVEALPDNILDDEPGRKKVQTQVASIKTVVNTPIEAVLEIFFQPHQSAATRIALEGGWLEALADGEAKTATEIALITGAQPELIVRIMLVLTATGVVSECGPQEYKATPVLQILLDPGWANGLKHLFDHCAPVLLRLPDYLARNGFQVPEDVKTGPFADTWGKNTWALYEAEPARGEVFNSFMTKWKQGTKNWFDTYPAKSNLSDQVDKSPDSVLLVDIGGGRGHVMQEFVAIPGHRTGRLIVQDQPAALGEARQLGKEGIEIMPYDFFTPQPIKGAKAYFFRAIFHDWPDTSCREILRNTAAAMKKGYSKLLIDEAVLPDFDVSRYEAFLDLTMMALETGAERSSKQWHDLLGSVGLRIEKIWPSGVGAEKVIEAVLE